VHAASWLNLEVQPSSPSELGLAHLLGRFFYQHMSGFDHQLINLIDNLRCEKTQVILDRLSFVRRFVLPASMPEHLPDRVVMVGQLMDAVVIGVETQTQHAKHQNLPLLHPGTTKTVVRFAMPVFIAQARAASRGHDPFQNLEYGGA